MSKTIRLGILGPGRIVRRMMKDFHKAEGLCLTAVASRDIERARAAASEYGAKYAFGSYEALAACDEVDLVYVATPHNFHCGQAMLMMEHKKHVLCEKPMALNREETERMVACAREQGVFLMEAMWTRFFPASEQLRLLLRDGAIGQITHLYAEFNCAGYPGMDLTGRALNPALAGGALLDLGVYPLMAATAALGWEPAKVQGLCQKAPTGVDLRAAMQMQFASGATAQIACAMDAMGPSREMIYGTDGMIEIPDFYHPTRFTLSRRNGSSAEYRFPAEAEGHHYEFEHAREMILAGRTESPLMTLAESVAVSGITTDMRREWGVRYPEEHGAPGESAARR